MPVRAFADLPETSRIWIYGAERPLTEGESEAVATHLDEFFAQWTAHERALAPSWQLVHNQFVIVAVDESAVSVSGCSIDSMSRALAGINRSEGLDFSNSGGRIYYRDAEGAVHCVDRLAFRELVKLDRVNENTIVFNNVIDTMGEFRAGRWEVPMRESWHMEAFGSLLTPTR